MSKSAERLNTGNCKTDRALAVLEFELLVLELELELLLPLSLTAAAALIEHGIIFANGDTKLRNATVGNP